MEGEEGEHPRTGRRRAREAALAILYCDEYPSMPLDSIPGEVAELLEVAGDPAEYARTIVEGVRDHRPELDDRIRAVSRNWRIERMSLIDRNILRIGAWEILFSDGISTAVAIDEAVEIARRFGDTESWSFVNGVLDAVAKGAVAEDGPV